MIQLVKKDGAIQPVTIGTRRPIISRRSIPTGTRHSACRTAGSSTRRMEANRTRLSISRTSRCSCSPARRCACSFPRPARRRACEHLAADAGCAVAGVSAKRGRSHPRSEERTRSLSPLDRGQSGRLADRATRPRVPRMPRRHDAGPGLGEDGSAAHRACCTAGTGRTRPARSARRRRRTSCRESPNANGRRSPGSTSRSGSSRQRTR